MINYRKKIFSTIVWDFNIHKHKVIDQKTRILTKSSLRLFELYTRNNFPICSCFSEKDWLHSRFYCICVGSNTILDYSAEFSPCWDYFEILIRLFCTDCVCSTSWANPWKCRWILAHQTAPMSDWLYWRIVKKYGIGRIMGKMSTRFSTDHWCMEGMHKNKHHVKIWVRITQWL